MKTPLAIFKQKIPTLVAMAKVDVIEVKHSYSKSGGTAPDNSVWHRIVLCFRMEGHQYSKVEISTELTDVHTRFVPGEEYVVVILPKDQIGDFGLVKNQYGIYSKE